MSKENRPKRDDEEESARFIETAERIQEEGAEERFEEILNRILPAKPGRTKSDGS
jgi:hypothetical protein